MTRSEITIAGLTILLMLSPCMASADSAPAEDWRTKAEITNYRETATYDETLEYIRRVQAKNPGRVRLTTFGVSAEGRPLPLVIVDREGQFTPDEVKRTGRAVVLIQSGIHSGEIDGKDASLALLRELAVTHVLSGFLTDVTILMIPIYNVDGHERRSEFNRINQNGPREMGFRTNANGLDLNRDYLKLESPEAQAFARLFSQWRPDFFVDCHVTDGADFQYDMTYAWQPAPAAPAALDQWMSTNIDRIVAGAEAGGHKLAPYIVLRDEAEPQKGMEGGAAPPRFSTGYTPLRNRPGLLVEAHMYKEYKVRVAATHDLLVSIISVVKQQKKSLLAAVRSLDLQKAEWGKHFLADRKIALRWGVEDTPLTFLFKTWRSQTVSSEVTGGKYTIYSREPIELPIPYFSKLKPEVEVVRPTGYLIPPSRSDVAEKLRQHGLRVAVLETPVESEFEMYRLSDGVFQEKPYQGHHPVSAKVTPVHEMRKFPKGSFYISLAQPDADVAIHLLEPQGPDSLFSWGWFDSIFERKEYYETAVIERLIAKEIAEDPSVVDVLAKEREKNPELKKNPEAMREWFYKRSPYWDKEFGLYPVARVTTQIFPLGTAKEIVGEKSVAEK